MSTLVEPGTVTDTTAVPGWTPVRVEATMAEPVIALDTNPLHLDGPLSYAGFLAHVDSHGHLSLPTTQPDLVDFALPLATWTAPAPVEGLHPRVLAADPNQVWGWACSAAHYSPDGWCTVDIRRRPATEAAARYSADREWHLSTGPLKARDVVLPATMVRSIVWWALADADRLETMLGRVHGIGRKPVAGNGRVQQWTVAEDPAAVERWRWRHLPDPAGPPQTIRAPYHCAALRMPCADIPKEAVDAAARLA